MSNAHIQRWQSHDVRRIYHCNSVNMGRTRVKMEPPDAHSVRTKRPMVLT